MQMTNTWQNRIVREADEAPDQLLANPRNFRIHPRPQQQALSGVLSEVGWVQRVLVNERTGHVIDGHLRIELALSRGEPTVPVTYVDLSPEEEALVLATFDPISALAVTDKAQLDALLREVNTGDQSVMAMLSDLAMREGITAPDFQPVGIDEQGRLDQKKRVTCPECGHEFTP